jgi:maltose O-acetyltransferase
MLAGKAYNASDPELVAERDRARKLFRAYNATTVDEREQRAAILDELLGRLGDGVWIEPPFFCDYGTNIELGNGVFLNFNCVVLDCARVEIGAGTLFGPAVQIYAATHSTDPAHRRTGLEYAAPVTVGANAWIGGAAILCPGVTIGDDTTIGAGSVVVKDVPAGVVAAGNPCRVIREL